MHYRYYCLLQATHYDDIERLVGRRLPSLLRPHLGCALEELVLVPIIGVSHRTGRLLLLEEVGVGDGGKDGSLVDDGGVVDLLLDGDGVVDGGGLDSLALDDGLD
jgi:hypothetical protein